MNFLAPRSINVMVCPPGHDAWIVGDQSCVVIDWTGVSDYAKRA